MATRLPSKLPGGRRRFEVRGKIRTKTAFESSPNLSTPAGRKNASTPSSSPGSVIKPQSDGAQDPEVMTPKANFADEDIKPEFLQDAGIDSDSEEVSETTNDNLAEDEASGDVNAGNSTALNPEESALSESDQNGSNHRVNLSDKSARVSGLRKKTIFASSGATAVIAIMLAVASAPGMILAHISNLITDNPASRNSQLMQSEYRRTNINKLSDLFSKEGRRGGAIIAEMQRAGYTFSFDKDGKTILGITKAGENLSVRNADGAVEKIMGDYMEKKHPVLSRSATWRNSRMEALEKRFGVDRTSGVIAKEGLEDAAKATNQRIFNIVNGELDSNGTPRVQVADNKDASDTQKASDQAQKDILQTSDDEAIKTAKQLAEGVEEKSAGILAAAGAEASEGVVGDAMAAAVKAELSKGVLSSATDTIKGAISATDVPTTLCNINKKIRYVTIAARATRDAKMLRYAYDFVAADDGQRKGEAASGLVREYIKRTLTKDNTGTYFGSTTGYSSMATGKYSLSKNKATRNHISVTGDVGGLLAGVKDLTSKVPLCSVWSNTAATLGINIGLNAITLFSGGTFKVAERGVVETIKLGAQTAIKNALTKSFVRRIAIDAAVGTIIQSGLDGIVAYVGIYAQKTLLFEFTGQERGGTLSMPLAGGAGSIRFRKDSLAGMVPASPRAYSQAHNEYLAFEKERIKTLSVFDKYLSLSSPDSLAYKTFDTVAFNSGLMDGVTSSSISNVAKIPSQFISSLKTLTQPFFTLAGADEVDPDIVSFEPYTIQGTSDTVAVDIAGNMLSTYPKSVLNIDHVENKIFLKTTTIQGGPFIDTNGEPIGVFAQHIENCAYGDVYTTLENNPDTTDPALDCLAKLTITQRFKAYMAYQNMDSITTGQLDPESVATSSQVASVSPSGVPSNLIAGTPIDPNKIKYDLTELCPTSPTIGNDRIETDAYINGQRFTIRLCNVHGVEINTIVAKQYDDLFNDMKFAGYSIKGSAGFRDMQSQIDGYAGGKGAGTYAKPGYSNHQFGTAVDISCQGNGTSYDPSVKPGRGRDAFLANISQYPCLNWVATNSFSYQLLLQCVGKSTDSGGEIRAQSGGCEWWHISPTGG